MDCSFDNQDIGCHTCGPLIQSLENKLQQLRNENEDFKRRVNELEKSRPSGFQCPLCLKFYQRADALKVHIENSKDEAHAALAEERYAIETCCSRSFKRRCDLDRHRNGRECEKGRRHGAKDRSRRTALRARPLKTVTTAPLPSVSATATLPPVSLEQGGNRDYGNPQSRESIRSNGMLTEESPSIYAPRGLTRGFNPSQSHSFTDGNYAGRILNTNQARAISHPSLEHVRRFPSDATDQTSTTSKNPFFAPLEETDYSLGPNSAMALEQAPHAATNILSTSVEGASYSDPPHPAMFSNLAHVVTQHSITMFNVGDVGRDYNFSAPDHVGGQDLAQFPPAADAGSNWPGNAFRADGAFGTFDVPEPSHRQG